MLKTLGYSADVANKGLEMISALQAQCYDIILMDAQMPEMDGLETASWIRKNFPESQKPYMIAMTANALDGDRKICLDAGMDDYVAKPIKIEKLKLVLQHFRERHKGK